jgi:hypothetical protein
VQTYLRELDARRPRSAQPDAALHGRILRIRQAWLRMPFLRNRDSCYLRSLTLYRFLDVGDEPMHVYFGVEERDDPSVRRRAHVWISVGGRTYEGPPEGAGRLREITLSEVSA